MSEDRTYWHHIGAPTAWHAVLTRNGRWFRFLCGRDNETTDGLDNEIADRIPPTAHLCGNCARSIAARTDSES